MAQIQHARTFNGTSDEIELDSTAYASVGITATTFVAIARRTTDAGWRWIWSLEGTSGGELAYGTDAVTAGSLTGYFNDGAGGTASPNTSADAWTAAMGWCLVAVTKADGAATPRNHVYRYDTQAWTHTDASIAGVDIAAPTAGTNLWLGTYDGASEFFQGDIACAGFWKDTLLTDAQLEGLVDDIDSWEVLSPTGLWLLNQPSTSKAVSDRVGTADQTAISGTTATSVSDLPFDVGITHVQSSAGTAITGTTGSVSLTGTTAGNIILLEYLLDGTASFGGFTDVVNAEDLEGSEGGLTFITGIEVGSPMAAALRADIGRSLGGTVQVDFGSATDDIFAIIHEFSGVATGTTLADVIEHGTGTSTQAQGTSATAQTPSIETRGRNRLIVALTGLNDDGLALDLYDPSWTGGQVQFDSASGTQGAVDMQMLHAPNPITKASNTDGLTASAAWGVIGFALKPAFGTDYESQVLTDSPVAYYRMNEAEPFATVLDNFDRANSGTLGANWTADISNQSFTSWSITSNTCDASAGGFDSNWWNVNTFGPDCEVHCTLTTLPTNQEFRLLARINNPGGSTITAYELEVSTNGGDVLLYRRDSDSSRTLLEQAGVSVAAGNQIALVCRGSVIQAFKNTGSGWFEIATAVDSTYSGTGYIGIWNQNNTTLAIDNFGGSNGVPPRDSSGYGNHATVSNDTPTYEIAGAIATDPTNTAIEFGTPDYFSVPDHSTLDVGDVGTVEAWIKRGDFATSEQTVVSKIGSYFLGLSNHKVFTGRAGFVGLLSGDTDVPFDGNWHHIAVVKNGDDLRVYLDGVLDGSLGGAMADWENSTNAVYIGAEEGPTSFFKGAIDEVAVYPTALSADRVRIHYLVGSSQYAAEVLADAPVAYYRMDEASGLIEDSSGYGNHVTAVVGTPAYEVAGGIATDLVSTAILFDGSSDRFTASDHATLDLGDVFTLECWISRSRTGVDEWLLSKGSGAYGLRINPSNTLELDANFVAEVAHSSITVLDDGWHHLVATKNGATTNLYIDGVNVTVGVTPTTLVDTSEVLTIANNGPTGGNDSPTGAILDEIAIYDTALSAERVVAHYAAGIAELLVLISNSGDDASVRGQSAVYATVAANHWFDNDVENLVEKGFTGGTYTIFNTLLRFDTSSLPDDATVTAATLRFVGAVAEDADGKSVVAEWYAFDGSISDADFSSTVVSDAHAGTPISTLTPFGSHDLELTGLTAINKTGYTGLRLHLTGGAPTGSNYITISDVEHATRLAPILIVEYTEGGVVTKQTFYLARTRMVRR